MAAGKHGSTEVTVSVDDSVGNPQVMTPYISDINSIDVEAITEESTAFGQTWFQNLAVGISKMADVVLGGFYDDTATTGPHAIFNAPGATRTATIGFGNSKTVSAEMIIAKYSRKPTRNGMTRFEVTLRPTGTVTEA